MLIARSEATDSSSSTPPSGHTPNFVAPLGKAGAFLIREASALDLAHLRTWLPEALGGTPAAQVAIATDTAAGTICGVAALRVFADRVGRFLLYVAPAFRRRGCGTALLKWVQATGSRAQVTAMLTGRSYEVGATDGDAAVVREFFQARNLSVAQEIVRYWGPFQTVLPTLEPIYQRCQRRLAGPFAPRIVPAGQVDSSALADFVVRAVGGVPEEVALRLNGSGRAYSMTASMVALVGNVIVGALLGILKEQHLFIEVRAVDSAHRGGVLNLALMHRMATVVAALGTQTIEFEHDTRERDTFKLAQRLGATQIGCRQCWGLPLLATDQATRQERPSPERAPEETTTAAFSHPASPVTHSVGGPDVKPSSGWQAEALCDPRVDGMEPEQLRDLLFFDSVNDVIHMLSERGIDGLSVTNHARGLTMHLKLVQSGRAVFDRTTGLKASLLFAALPESADRDIFDTLAAGLGLDIVTIGANGRSAAINPRLAMRLAIPGTMCSTHADAQVANLAPINRFLDRMVVHVCDPRQAMLSLVHQLNDLYLHKGVGRVAGFGLPLPNQYFDLPLTEQIDFMIEHGLPELVRWIEGWIEAAANPLFRTRVLFTCHDEFRANPLAFFRSILEHYGIGWRTAEFKPLATASGNRHHRAAEFQEWRAALTPAQREAVAVRVPTQILDRFGWSGG